MSNTDRRDDLVRACARMPVLAGRNETAARMYAIAGNRLPNGCVWRATVLNAPKCTFDDDEIQHCMAAGTTPAFRAGCQAFAAGRQGSNATCSEENCKSLCFGLYPDAEKAAHARHCTEGCSRMNDGTFWRALSAVV